MVFERELGVQPTPSHRVASLLNGAVLAPTFTVAVGAVFFLRNIAASVFPWSKATPLPAAQSTDAAAAPDGFAAAPPRLSPSSVVHKG